MQLRRSWLQRSASSSPPLSARNRTPSPRHPHVPIPPASSRQIASARKAEARSAALEAELDEARDLIRDQSAQAEVERGRLLTQLAETERERDRPRWGG